MRRLSMRIPLAVCALLVVSCAADPADVGSTTGTGTGTGTVPITALSPAVPTVPTAPTVPDPATQTTPLVTDSATTRVDAFDPPCVEYRNSRTTYQLANEAALDAFGALPAEPTLQISLPVGRATATAGPVVPGVIEKRIPGGVLLAIGASGSASTHGSIVAAVDADEARRWVRCYADRIDGVFVAPASSVPTKALVEFAPRERTSDRTSKLADWKVLSLDNGSLVTTLTDLLASQGVDPGITLAGFPKTTSSSKIVLGPPDDTVIDIARDHMFVLDLQTFTVESIPFPPSSAGFPLFSAQIEFADSGELVLNTRLKGLPAVEAAYHAGAWTTSAPILRTAYGPRAQFAESGSGLIGFDALGHPIWRYDNVSPPQGEGFRIATSGAVTVVSGCFAVPDPKGCIPTSLAGIATKTGKVLWQIRGWHLVSAIGDGRALISGPSTIAGSATAGGVTPVAQAPGAGPWLLIDTATGKLVDSSQQWADPNAFRTECCGGGEFEWVGREGGVVTAVDGTDVAIWYPSAAGLAAATVSLP